MPKRPGQQAVLTVEESDQIYRSVAKVFQPRSPITTKDLFAGRWDELMKVVDAAHQVGVHAVIYGERGVGKTSLSNIVKPTIHVMDQEAGLNGNRLVVRAVAESNDSFSELWKKSLQEISWHDNRPMMGLTPLQRPPQSMLQALGISGDLKVDAVRRALALLPGVVFIVDEFDRAARSASRQFTDLMKALADLSMDVTIVLVGVAETVGKLVTDHASINRSLVQVHLPRMGKDDLREILQNAERKLGVVFTAEAADFVIQLSQGLPHYTHLIGLHSVRCAVREEFSRIVDLKSVFAALKLAIRDAEHTTTERYLKATHSAHQDALYRHVLLACAVSASKSSDPYGFFSASSVIAPLSEILERPVQVATFNNHLSEFAQSENRGNVLQRQGETRGYRYRFTDPLLVPFAFMNASATNLLSDEVILSLIRN